MAEKAMAQFDNLAVHTPVRNDKTTKPATEFEFMPVTKSTRRVLKKGQPPFVKSSDVLPCEGKPQRKKKRYNLHTDGCRPVSFISPAGEDGEVGLGTKKKEQLNEEMLWNELQMLIAMFETMEADYIQKFQDKLNDLRGVWEQKLKEIAQPTMKDVMSERDKEESALLEVSNIEKSTNSSEASALSSQVQDLRTRLSEKEKECYLLKKELESKEGQLREVKKNLSEREVMETNLSGVESLLNLCATLKRKDHQRNEQDDIKTRIITTMKHIQRLKLGELWQAWTI